MGGLLLALSGVVYYFLSKSEPSDYTQLQSGDTRPDKDTGDMEALEKRRIFYPEGTTGYAISWPQCGTAYPAPPYDFGVLGVTRGHSFSHNPCLMSELEWARKAKYYPSFYINLDYPAPLEKNFTRSYDCQLEDEKCIAYHYGYQTAKDSVDYALSQGALYGNWWLDVQIVSKWSLDKTVNAQVALGAIDYFKSQNLFVGLSTTPYQWNSVMGTLRTNLPNWIPGRATKEIAAHYCIKGESYSGGHVKQLAYIAHGFEAVYSCGE